MTEPGQGASVLENVGEVALHQLGRDSREAECEGRRATVTLGSFKSPALRQPPAPLHWTVMYSWECGTTASRSHLLAQTHGYRCDEFPRFPLLHSRSHTHMDHIHYQILESTESNIPVFTTLLHICWTSFGCRHRLPEIRLVVYSHASSSVKL